MSENEKGKESTTEFAQCRNWRMPHFVLFLDMYRLCLDLRILRLCLDLRPPLVLMYPMFISVVYRR